MRSTMGKGKTDMLSHSFSKLCFRDSECEAVKLWNSFNVKLHFSCNGAKLNGKAS